MKRAMHFAALICLAATTYADGPRSEDVQSVDSIVRALYDSISGPAGKRDWDRMRNLFVAKAPMGYAYTNRRTNKPGIQTFSLDDYIRLSGAYFEKNPFFESEIARKTEQWDRMVTIQSTYASRKDPKDPKPFERGINSIQLLNDGARWWIASIVWEGEEGSVTLPKQYLPGG